MRHVSRQWVAFGMATAAEVERDEGNPERDDAVHDREGLLAGGAVAMEPDDAGVRTASHLVRGPVGHMDSVPAGVREDEVLWRVTGENRHVSGQ